MREIGRRWKMLSAEDKKLYEELAAEDKLKRARETIRGING